MRRLFIVLSICLAVIAAGCSRSEDKPSAEAAESRIVSTTVAITEILDALEVDEVVGKPTSYKELPKRYMDVVETGNPMNPDLEIIASLNPTDILSVTTLEYDLKAVFDEAGLPADYLDFTSLSSMQDEITELGRKYDRTEQAAALNNRFKEKIDEIEAKTADKDKPKVLILLGVPGSYLVATDKSYIGDLVSRVGGENVVQGENVEYLASNTEYLQQSNPDVILRAAHGMPKEVVDMFDDEFKTNDIWKHFSAVQNNRVYDLEETLFGTTGNLAADKALDELYTMLYEEK
ncbi:heme ABC transporter substrate-binding protein IsdE [Terribacillus saccharophilus]|uniref:heme ABC transporter substrate-binding protein IsdE n=1 Tax=Terribacillus saccharophilus TaxID=361277 RepID=UPI002DCC71E2|nr:heme ABC transporter substrate-binding protein IsdE [Terribacillus saccharophilus]MEC0291753.1 heme ABC transporter substrate-binding protein IsdE [Terribacillus saccharophilus]